MSAHTCTCSVHEYIHVHVHCISRIQHSLGHIQPLHLHARAKQSPIKTWFVQYQAISGVWACMFRTDGRPYIHVFAQCENHITLGITPRVLYSRYVHVLYMRGWGELGERELQTVNICKYKHLLIYYAHLHTGGMVIDNTAHTLLSAYQCIHQLNTLYSLCQQDPPNHQLLLGNQLYQDEW